ncbi:metallophosphoesterase, partial [Streptomyces prunicolor]|uniref:metallophosphoesterase n=1 Tax=Streptomyces prunicolor TaxID=67348 RepID=UPI0033D23656
MKRVVVVSDVQAPFEDKRALKNVIEFIGEYQPDEVIQIGDLVDYPAPSRWSAGTRAEFEGNVIRDSEYTKENFLEPLRVVYDGPVGVMEGNHD